MAVQNPYWAEHDRYAKLLLTHKGIKYDAAPAKETIRIMLDGYCAAKDAGDEEAKCLYISGLMERFRDKPKKIVEKGSGLVSYDDAMAWLYEAIEYACKYRKWQVDPNVNAQQCINMCIETIRQQHYYEMNLDKHKANYLAQSLDAAIDDDAKVSYIDTVEDEAESDYIASANAAMSAQGIIQGIVDKNRLVEAIILDVIAHGDSVRVRNVKVKGFDEDGNETEVKSTEREFWAFKAIQMLSDLPQDYERLFSERYVVKKPELIEAALSAIRGMNGTKLKKQLERTLSFAKAALSAQ